MNLGQLIDPEWAQAGLPQRFKPAPRPELIEAQERAERQRKAEAGAAAEREQEARKRTAEILAQRHADAEAARRKRQEEATAAAQQADALRLDLPATTVKIKGQRPVAQLKILRLLRRSTVRLGSSAIAQATGVELTHTASHLSHMIETKVIDRTGLPRMYRYAITKLGREKLERYGFET